MAIILRDIQCQGSHSLVCQLERLSLVIESGGDIEDVKSGRNEDEERVDREVSTGADSEKTSA